MCVCVCVLPPLQFCIMPTDKRSPSFVFYVAKTRTSDLVSPFYKTLNNSSTNTLRTLVSAPPHSVVRYVRVDNAAVYWEPRHVHEATETRHDGGPADEGPGQGGEGPEAGGER